LQQAYYQQAEQLLLSAYTKGLIGTAGRQVRFSSPETSEESLRIAVTVSQAEQQEKRYGAFYAKAEAVDIKPAGRAREPAAQQVAARQ